MPTRTAALAAHRTAVILALGASFARATASAASPYCSASTFSVCTALSGVQCNRSSVACPPCLFVATNGNVIVCLNQVNGSCPSELKNASFIADCGLDLPTAGLSPNSTASSSSNTVMNDVVPYIIGGVIICAAIVALVSFVVIDQRRRRRLAHSTVPFDKNQPQLVHLDVPRAVRSLKTPLVELPTPLLSEGGSVRSFGSDGDILNTEFMRFRTTRDYAGDERQSTFSTTSSRESFQPGDEVEI
ncbi:hypothetical protein Ae201684P_016776 [Aphanomyces euteiches]|nr:hypothetical protein Ae201684P_016776 [Aphanomyces euteiches]